MIDMYYAVVDGRVVAYHKSKKVVSRYVKGYASSHPTTTCLLTKANHNLKDTRINSDGDMELMKMGKIYLQRKYEEAYYVYGYADVSTLKKCIKLLKKTLLHEKNFTKMIELNKGISELEAMKYDRLYYVPSISEMEDATVSVMEYRCKLYS